jgi:ADP-ribosyl-[dinitrogen reductase] hydrolase
MNTGSPGSETFRGLLLGTAVGDALGLPAEGLTPQTIEKLGWTAWRHRLLVNRGMVSDDTEHTIFVAQSLLKHAQYPDAFQACLAWKLRFWLLGLPAGTGKATAISILKLWAGVPPPRSAVFSAGNGPSVRGVVIGAALADNEALMVEMIRRSTLISHSDPRALVGALAVGYAAAFAVSGRIKEPKGPSDLLGKLKDIAVVDAEWQTSLGQLEASLAKGRTVKAFAADLGLQRGVTGYVYHTVPVAIYAWLRHQGDFRKTLTSVLSCGGDTDTTGAITGALTGATGGETGIPAEWIDHIAEWPRTMTVLRKIADSLALKVEGKSVSPVAYFWPGVIFRNLLFILIVLGHGFLRLIPASLRRRLAGY